MLLMKPQKIVEFKQGLAGLWSGLLRKSRMAASLYVTGAIEI